MHGTANLYGVLRKIDGVAVVVTRLRTGRPRNRGSIADKGKTLCCFVNRPGWLCGPPSLLFSGHWQILVPRLRMSGAGSSLPPRAVIGCTSSSLLPTLENVLQDLRFSLRWRSCCMHHFKGILRRDVDQIHDRWKVKLTAWMALVYGKVADDAASRLRRNVSK